jgi:hypothetical protein
MIVTTETLTPRTETRGQIEALICDAMQSQYAVPAASLADDILSKVEANMLMLLRTMYYEGVDVSLRDSLVHFHHQSDGFRPAEQAEIMFSQIEAGLKATWNSHCYVA